MRNSGRKFWFRKNDYFGEWIPVSWQGFIIFAVYFVLFLLFITSPDISPVKSLIFIISITMLFIYVVYKKGDARLLRRNKKEDNLVD